MEKTHTGDSRYFWINAWPSYGRNDPNAVQNVYLNINLVPDYSQEFIRHIYNSSNETYYLFENLLKWAKSESKRVFNQAKKHQS
jgi:hypothetical protein